MHARFWPSVRNLAIGAVLAGACEQRTRAVDAIEFYNVALDHYFVTASSDEIISSTPASSSVANAPG